MVAAFVELLQQHKLTKLTKPAAGSERGTIEISSPPAVKYMGAQRWGSAIRAHPDLGGETSPTRTVLSNVAYDTGKRSWRQLRS
jgi:hypothetical protein